MKLSIVSTLYQSSPYIEEFYRRATAAAQELVGNDYEIILVNDGSPDDSLKQAVELTDIDDHITVIDLSRNFGHHKAMMTGLEHSQGEKVFLIDSDLEEEPEWLIDFDNQMSTYRCDVVYGVQKRRKGNWFERWSGHLFYSLFSSMTDLKVPENVVTARLMTSPYVGALLMHREREVFLLGLWHITGFDQRHYVVHKHSHSKTTYSIVKKVSLAANSITSFSNSPLKVIFYTGSFIWIISLIYITYLVINLLFLAKPLSGWTSIMASIWFLGGLIISFIGVIGIYLSKVFLEIKQRPYTIIKRVYARPKQKTAQ